MDRGWNSVFWRQVKRTYCSGFIGKAAVLSVFIPYFALRGLTADLCRLKNPVRRYRDYKKKRGMSKFYDWIDWLGGYPFEVATKSEVIGFVETRGFTLQKVRNTEYVFGRG